MQEKRVDDYWNVDSNRSLSDSWKGFTKFTLLKENLPRDICGLGGELTKVQTTTRPDHVWPEVWTKIGEQEWKNEKPKLDNARRLRGIYFIDPDDQDYKETLKNARRNLKRPMAAAMPCKRKARTGTTKVAAKEDIASQKISKTVSGRIVESHESTRDKSGIFSTYKTRRSHCGQRFHFYGPLQFWFTNLFLCLKRCRFRMQKLQWTRNGQKLETIRARHLEKVRSKKGGYSRKHKEAKRKSTLLHWWTYVTSKKTRS